MKKTVLLCPPSYFRVFYEINPWMHKEIPVDTAKAWEQYGNLKNTIESLGVETWEIDPLPEYPDMVFTANLGFVDGKTYIPPNFRYKERVGERQPSINFFRSRGYEIRELSQEIPFEGEGDFLKMGNRYFFGWGKRSAKEAKSFLEKILGSEVIDFEVNNPYFYHLDTCFMPLNNETVVINPEAFFPADKKKIYDLFDDVIESSPEDNKLLCCNLVTIEKNILVGSGISEVLQKEFEKRGFNIFQINTSEFNKSGGSVKCLTLKITPL